ARPVALGATALRAQLGPRTAFEREIGEPDARLLAELHHRKPQIAVQRQLIGTDLIEHGPAAVAVRELAKTPHQLLLASALADRIAERHPTAAVDLVHQERIPGGAE